MNFATLELCALSRAGIWLGFGAAFGGNGLGFLGVMSESSV